MKRSAGVTVVAVLALLGSLLTLGMGCLMGLVFLVAPTDKSLDPNLQPLMKVGMIVTLIVFAGLSAWGIASAIGLFRLKQWARISTLIFSGLLIFFGIISPIFILMVPMPSPANAGADFALVFKAVITGFYLSFAAIGLWWMIFLTRPKVKVQFAAGGVVGEPSRRPVSITIIGWILIVTACFVPINLWLRLPMIVFGYVLTGWAAAATLIFMAAVSIIAGVGLLRLRPEGRVLTIGYLVFGMCNGVVTWMLPGRAERLARMMDAMPAAFRVPGQPQIDPRYYAFFIVPLMLVPLYFVIRNKKAFEPPPVPEIPASFPG